MFELTQRAMRKIKKLELRNFILTENLKLYEIFTNKKFPLYGIMYIKIFGISVSETNWSVKLFVSLMFETQVFYENYM